MESDDTENTVSSVNGKKRKRGIILLPSLFTAAALFSGFYSIIYTANALLYNREEFKNAVIAIILAGFFDSLDGRMARLMKAESEFGYHFDSIADVVSFGVAPAILVYGCALHNLGRLGFLASFAFLACAAVRLARFNVISTTSSKKYFKGMSSPVAAGGLALSAYMMSNQIQGASYHWVVFGMTVSLAFLMVSNVRFRTFKDLDFHRYPFQFFLIAISIVMMIFSFQQYALLSIFVVYLFGGIIEELVLWRRRRKSDPSVPFRPFGDKE